MSSRRQDNSGGSELPHSVTKLPGSATRHRGRDGMERQLGDPIVQGIILIMSGALFASVSWALRSSGETVLSTVPLAAGAGCFAAFLLLAGRAIERDKLVAYWQDRRELRIELRRSNAQTRLLARAINHAVSWKGVEQPADVDAALRELVVDAQGVLAARHDDAVVLLAFEHSGRNLVLFSSVPAGSRHRALRRGKTCTVPGGGVDETLSRLARYHRDCSVNVAGGALRMVALSDDPFDDCDEAMLDRLPRCLALLAVHWRPEASECSSTNLRIVL